MVPFETSFLLSIYPSLPPFLSYSLSSFVFSLALLPPTLYLSSTERFRSFFDGPTPIPTIDVFLVRADALQALPPLHLLLSVSVSVSGEDVSAASFRSQKQPDHHPRDHSSHLWNDRNGVACYVSDLERTSANPPITRFGRGVVGRADGEKRVRRVF